MTGQPIRIAAFLGTQALGDYVMYHLTAGSVARALDARLTVIFRDDRPYKTTLNALNPLVDEVIEVPDESRGLLPLDMLAAGENPPEILLTPSMMDFGQCIGTPPVMRLPDRMAAELDRDLRECGIDPGRWFCCLHLREPNYVWRLGADRLRDVDPTSYLPLIRRLIDTNGGQVVRVGDPSMTPLPKIDGLFELGLQPDSFALQAYALSRARFFIGNDSGPTQLACALGTPAMSTNALGVGVWNPGDAVLFKTYRRSDGGGDVPVADIVAINPMLGNKRPSGLDYIAVSPEDLVAAGEHMFEVTRDGPRDLGEGTEPAARLQFPLPWRDMTDFADLTYLD